MYFKNLIIFFSKKKATQKNIYDACFSVKGFQSSRILGLLTWQPLLHYVYQTHLGLTLSVVLDRHTF